MINVAEQNIKKHEGSKIKTSLWMINVAEQNIKKHEGNDNKEPVAG